MIEKKGAIDPVELTCLLNGTKTKEQEENYEFNDQYSKLAIRYVSLSFWHGIHYSSTNFQNSLSDSGGKS